MEEDFQERMKREPWEEQTGQKSSDEQSNYNEETPLEKQNGLELNMEFPIEKKPSEEQTINKESN